MHTFNVIMSPTLLNNLLSQYMITLRFYTIDKKRNLKEKFLKEVIRPVFKKEKKEWNERFYEKRKF